MRLPLFSWLLLLLSYTDGAYGQCLDDQKQLLLQLKHNISFSAPPPNLASWDSNTDCCASWVGIECDGNGYVIGIDLNSRSISGGGLESSSSLFKLKYLRRLNLSHNNFNSATIPSGLEQLTGLTHLNLSNSGFAGQVPLALARMTRLVSLDLSTLFAGVQPLKLESPNLTTLVRELVELRELYLDGVNISMHGMEWCHALSSSLPNLSVLSLSNCYLSGPPDSSLLKLRSLSMLRLGENLLSAPIPDFVGNFSNLSSLDFGSCRLNGKFPESIFQLPLLRNLDVSDNQLLRGSLPEFPQNSSLENLVLSKTSLSGSLPESIGSLRFLSRLDLTECGFSGLVPASISNLTRLGYIDLSSNNFTGPLPYFGLSENLTHVNLAHNRLTGNISSSLRWGRHLKLVNLNLRNNSLNETIPSSLFTLPSLQKLDLSQNRFSGRLSEVPNGSSLLMLDTLDLSNNLLEGSIPTSLFDISSLKIITLSSNNLSGSVWLDRFQTLRNLSSLDLSGNSISINSTGVDSALFPQVSTLLLASCNLKTFPEFLSDQSQLISLDLSNNQIPGKIPNWLSNVGNGYLAHLNLSGNSLESPDEPFVEDQFKSLAVVDLHSNLLQGPIPILPPQASVLDYSNNKITSIPTGEGASSLGFIIFFSLSNNSLTGEIPSSLCEAEYLQVLDLSDNNLSGSIPKCLGNISTLRVLNLRNNELNGTLPKAYPGACNLRTLDLNGNKLKGEVYDTLANCTMLEVLDLGNNQISGPFPCGLGELPYLRVLVLRNNKFSESISYRVEDANTTFQSLQIIDISSNNFTGILPAGIFTRLKGMRNEDEAESNYKHSILRFGFLELSHLYYQDAVTVTSKGQQMELVKILTIFTSIDLSNNKFEGEIPDAIGSLSALYVLNLSRNALTGSIPSSLGNLRQLESLDLSGNKLTGQIPSELEDLTFLSSLNLSFNQLVGTIPQHRQFQTFNQNVFEGNRGLCGPPLSTNCTNTRFKLAPSPSNSEPTLGGFNWQFIITGLGFGGGTAVIVTPLWCWAEGRKWFDRQMARLLLIIISSTTLFYNSRVDPVSESSLEQERGKEKFMEDYSSEEEDSYGSGRYCVFCTKLDSSMKRVVHNPKCNCQSSELLLEISSSV